MAVLVLDDDEISLKILSWFLSKRNYEPIVARNAKEALKMLESGPDIKLVITDIMLPEIDGFEFIRLLRRNPKLKDIPIVICSILAYEEYVREAMKLGCRHYFVKPIQQWVFIKKVDEILLAGQSTLKSKHEVMNQFGLDENLYDEVFDEFFKSLEKHIAILEERLLRGSVKKIPVTLTKVSESAIMWGAYRLKEEINKMFDLSKREVDNKSLSLAYKSLLGEMKSVYSIMSELKEGREGEQITATSRNETPGAHLGDNKPGEKKGT